MESVVAFRIIFSCAMVSILAPLWAPLTSAKRQRGGWRQQLEIQNDGTQTQCSHLAAGQIQAWSDGKSSAAQLHRHMANAVKDGMQHPMIVRINNICTLETQHKANHGMLAVLETTGIPDLISKLDGPVSDLVLPSTWAKLLCDNYPHEFRRRLGADPTLTLEFWTDFLKRPPVRDALPEHVFLCGKVAQDLIHTIPCVVHEDAAPVSKTKSANCIQFSSVLCKGEERKTIFLCCSVLTSIFGSNRTACLGYDPQGL